MKRIFSFLIAVCFILTLTSCNIPDDASQSTSMSETTDTSTDSGETNEAKGYTFTAKVLEVHEKTILIQTADEKMLTSCDQFYASVPETVSAEDFAVGDTVEIELAKTYRIEETYPARLPDVVNIRHIVRKTTAVIENITFAIRNNPDPILFKARITFSSGQSFYAKGFHDENGRETFTGYVYFPADIDLTDYKDGDYVEIGYDGLAMATYPLQANALSIRHLTEEEIQEIRKDEKTDTLTLQYMGQDEYELIGIASTAYSIDPDTLENIPDLNFKDYFTIVYDGTKCSFFVSATRIPFVKEIYRSDSRGNRID